MPSDGVLLERERQAGHVLANLCRLALSDHGYIDLVHAVLTALEELVESPLLCLSVRERQRVGHYARPGEGADSSWAEDAARGIAEVQETWLQQPAPGMSALSLPGALGGDVWFRMFPAWSRSGRGIALSLAASVPVEVSPAEEAMMARLTEQALLVLDHALLLEQVEELETTDSLTGVANLHRLIDVLDREIQRHRHDGAWLALLVIDVQGLDRINRAYGRRYGNHVLIKLAGLLQQAARPIDLVARSGLDEFAVVLPQTDEEQGLRLAGDLRDRLQHVEFAGGEISLTIGVAHVKPSEILTPEELLRRAEQALHQDKQRQRAWSGVLQPQRLR